MFSAAVVSHQKRNEKQPSTTTRRQAENTATPILTPAVSPPCPRRRFSIFFFLRLLASSDVLNRCCELSSCILSSASSIPLEQGLIAPCSLHAARPGHISAGEPSLPSMPFKISKMHAENLLLSPQKLIIHRTVQAISAQSSIFLINKQICLRLVKDACAQHVFYVWIMQIPGSF